MASVEQRGRKYHIRFRYEGRSYRTSVGSPAKAESVKLVCESTITDLMLGRLTIPDGVNIGKFIASGGRLNRALPKQNLLKLSAVGDAWQQGRPSVASTTKNSDAKHLRHLKAYFGDDADIRRLNVQGYVEHRLRTVSPTTVRKELVTLRSVLAGHVRIDLKKLQVPVEPPKCRFASLSATENGRRVLLSPSEVVELRKFIRENGSELISDVTDFIAFTEARRSEVCRLRPSDIDFAAGTLTITEKKRKHGHTTYRTLAIHPMLRPVLKRRLGRGGFVFTDSINSLSSGLKEAIEGSKFDKHGFGYHVLRHSVASQLLSHADVSAVTVAAVLGHASTQTTLNTYAHAFDSETTRAVGLL